MGRLTRLFVQSPSAWVQRYGCPRVGRTTSPSTVSTAANVGGVLTGADPLFPVAAGAVLLALGAGMYLIARRRRA